jgi:PEP-CTERM motif
MRLSLILGAALLIGAQGAGTVAYGDTIDFEAQGSGRGSTFFGTTPDSPLPIGIATFTGGVLLKAESGLPADTTAVYATANFPGLTNPLNIVFSAPVSAFSVLVLNGINDFGSYLVTDNLGGTATALLAPNPSSGAFTFALAESGITSVSITGPTFGSPSDLGWDFSIDNVTFTPVSATVPEPGSLALLGSGLVGIFFRRPKRA